MSRTKRNSTERDVNYIGARILTDHGIYTELAFNGNSTKEQLRESIQQAEVRYQSAQSNRLPETALDILLALLETMRAKVRGRIIGDDAEILPVEWNANCSADLGSGVQSYFVDAERIAGINEAAHLTILIASFLATEPSERLAAVFLEGAIAGRLLEQIEVLPHESNALKGKRQVKRAVAAGRTRQPLTDEQIADAVADIQATMKAKKCPLQTACKSLETKYGVTYRTLKRYFKRAEAD